MARPRQPIDLIEAKKKAHFTKAQIEERRSKEVKAPCDSIEPPEYLPEELVDEFYYYVKQLVDINIMSNLDIETLAVYLMSKKVYVDLTLKILKNVDILTVDKTIMSNQDKAYKQCMQAANSLGLNISSRCKLVIPKKETEKPTQSIDDMLLGGI